LIFLPLQLPDEIQGVAGFEAAVCEAKTFANEFELGGEHLLLLNELPQEVMVLAIARDVGDDTEVVSEEGSVAELFEMGTMPDEHVMEPRGESDRDEATYGRGIDRLGVGPLPGFLVACEPVDTSGIARVEADEAGSDQIAILTDVEARDEVIVVNVALGWGVPAFCDLTQVFFEVGDDILKASDLRGVLGGAGLDGECEAVDELPKVLHGDVRVSIEGGEHRSGGQWRGVGERGSGWRGGERDGRDGSR